VFEKDLENSMATVYKHIFEEQKSKKMGGLD